LLMGKRGRAFVSQNFSYEIVGKKMQAVFEADFPKAQNVVETNLLLNPLPL
jgi:hypothetical protein